MWRRGEERRRGLGHGRLDGLQAVLGTVQRELGALGIDSFRTIQAAEHTLRSLAPGVALGSEHWG